MLGTQRDALPASKHSINQSINQPESYRDGDASRRGSLPEQRRSLQ